MVFVKLQEFWAVTNRGILGPLGCQDCVQSNRVLGRIVEWTADGITGRQILDMRVTGRSVATPGVRDKLTDIEGEVPIDKEASDRCRANRMRAQCLSSDRPDIRIECRDLARKMQQPSNVDEIGLKRLARFLGVRPRMVWLFKWEKRVRLRCLFSTMHLIEFAPVRSLASFASRLSRMPPPPHRLRDVGSAAPRICREADVQMCTNVMIRSLEQVSILQTRSGNDNGKDHPFSQLPVRKALTCPESQSAWAVAPPWLAKGTLSVNNKMN